MSLIHWLCSVFFPYFHISMEVTQINVLSFPLESSVHLGVTKFSRWVMVDSFPFNASFFDPGLASYAFSLPLSVIFISLSLSFIVVNVLSSIWVPSPFHFPSSCTCPSIASLHPSTPCSNSPFWAFQGSSYLVGLLIPLYGLLNFISYIILLS